MKPDVVILDIAMPVLNGVEAARQLRELAHPPKIVMLTQQANRTYVQEAFRSGANAYVLKQAAASELLTAIDEVMEGRYYISPLISPDAIAVGFNPKVNPSELFGGNLTPRQREVLQLIAEGRSAKQIAATLGISVKTVEFHKAAIMGELGLRTAAELTRYAIECGIVG
jgi:DNA-binding NarL/FixJ family response regulator